MNKWLLLVVYMFSFCSFSFAQNILILEDQGTQDSVYSILSDAGYNVTLGGNYWEYTGMDLDQYDLVIFLNGVVYWNVMPDSVQQKLRNYVGNGGRLFTIEWLLWSGAVNITVTSMLPVLYAGSWSVWGEEYYKQTDHPIAISLPDTFSISSNSWSYSRTIRDTTASKEAVTVFRGSQSGDAVVSGRHENGKVVHWNMGGQWYGSEFWSPEVKTLLRNTVSYLLGTTSVDEAINVPYSFSLSQNYPNPFNPSTMIGYTISVESNVLLEVYNMLGQRVAVLVDEFHRPGSYNVQFNAANLSSGVYLYRIRAGEFTAVRKLIVAR